MQKDVSKSKIETISAELTTNSFGYSIADTWKKSVLVFDEGY